MAKSYHISFNGTGWTQFYPENTPLITSDKEGDEMFLRYGVDNFRIAKSNNSAVYGTLETMFFDSSTFNDAVYFKVQKEAVDKYLFKCSVNEGKLNKQNGVYDVTPTTNDDYRVVMDKYENEYRAAPWGDSFYIPKLNSASFTNVDFDTFTDIAGAVTWAATGDQYARNLLDIIISDNTRVYVFITNFTGDDFELTIINQAGTALGPVVSVDGNGLYSVLRTGGSSTSVYLRCESEDAPGPSGTFTYEAWYPSRTGICQLLTAYIEEILGVSYMNTGLSVVSTYLNNDALGSDPPALVKTFIDSSANGNYAGNSPGFRGSNFFNDVVIGQNKGVTGETGDEFKTSLKDIMDILKVKLRCWWHIDEDGNFRIEHEKYYRGHDPQIDITTATYTPYKPEVDALEYTNNKGDLVSNIKYKETNETNEDFVPYPVVYELLETTKNVKDINVSITTDIQELIDNPTSADSNGLYLAKCTLVGTNYHVDYDTGEISGDSVLNAKLAWSYLFRYFWTYFQEAGSASVNNGTAITSLKAKEFLKQDNVSFQYTGELSWIKPITTSNGTGWIEKIEESESEFVKLNIGFDPYA